MVMTPLRQETSCPVCHTEIVQGFSNVLDKPVSNHVLDSDDAILKGVVDKLGAY